MALAAAHRQGKCPADVPICCAEWKAPEPLTRRGRILGQRPRSRVTNQRRLSEDEVAVLFESIGDDLDSIGFPPPLNSGNDGKQNPAARMTDRELVGAILSGGPAVFNFSSLVMPKLGGATRPGGLTFNGIKDLRTSIGEALDTGIFPEGTSEAELRQFFLKPPS